MHPYHSHSPATRYKQQHGSCVTHSKTLHVHVSTLAIAEAIFCCVTLPVAARVHCLTVGCDGVSAARFALRVDALQGGVQHTGTGKLQAVHPAVGMRLITLVILQRGPGISNC